MQNLPAKSGSPESYDRNIRATLKAREIAAAVLRPGDIAIDATAGNGNDTAFLAGIVGDAGHVYAFDIQQPALDATLIRLKKLNLENRVTLIRAGHETMPAHLPESLAGNVAAIFFNLGYLPRGDEKIITKPEKTLTALNHAKKLLRPGGLLSLLVYPAHAGGADEAIVVKNRIQNEITAGGFNFSFHGDPEQTARPWLASGISA